ncbi:MAG: prolipoprotein diacylglyceryl transferase [Kiritimatiellia bacterium]
MHSLLFKIGEISVFSYGLCMAIGFLAAWQVAIMLCRQTGRNADQLTTLITWLMISAISGARLAYVIEHWEAEFASDPFSIIMLNQGGLMFYGGFIAAAIFTGLYVSIKKINLFEISDILLSVLPLGHAFGRIGCFMHGCCYGKVTQSSLGVCFPAQSPAWWEQTQKGLIAENALKSLPVIPTQLIESAANLLLFGVMLVVFKKNHAKKGFASGVYLVSYAFIRFCVEFLRGDPRAMLGPLSISQAISLGVAAAGIFIIAYSIKISRQHTEQKTGL